MKLLRRLYFRLFKRYHRIETLMMPTGSAELLAEESADKPEHLQWHILPVDRFTTVGWVRVERRERIWE